MTKGKMYWHQLPDDLVKHLFEVGRITWGEIMELYNQPPWCEYPHALNGALGCWSLVDEKLRHEISVKFCADCHLFKKVKK